MFKNEDIDKIIALENEIGSKGLTVNIFDYDGTLFNSPVPNPSIWDKAMIGKLKGELKQNSLGWYQDTLSLSKKYIDEDNFIESTVDEVRKSMNDPYSITVLLTGRSLEYTNIIKTLVDKKGLKFDYTGLKNGGKTIEFKYDFIKSVVDDLKSKGNTIDKINIWEDRESHVKLFDEFLKSSGIPYQIHFVQVKDYHMPEHLEKELVELLKENYKKVHGKDFQEPVKSYYFSAILDSSSKTKLLEYLKGIIEIPKDWKVIAHHVTLVPPYITQEGTVVKWCKENIGKTVSITVNSIGMSDKAMAVGVSMDAPCMNKIPHITIAISSTGKAKDSNFITDWKQLENTIQLSGEVHEG